MASPLTMQDITNTQEIVQMHEAFTDTDDPEFEFTEVFFRQKGKLYHTISKEQLLSADSVIPTFDIDHIDVILVPPTAYQAEWIDGITKYEGQDPLSPDVFLKTPRLVDYDPTGSRSMASRVQPEVKILERIKADKDKCHENAGENIGEYYGCSQSSDGLFIAGICLKRYPRTLMDIVYSKNRQFADPEKSTEFPSTDPTKIAEHALPIQPEKVIEGLIKGIQYLHGLDIIHGDINPANIMFDKEGRPVIIDFNISVRRGERKLRGTFSWIDGPEFSTTATEDIDIRALYRVVIFMHKKFTLDGLELPPNYDGAADDFGLIKHWLAGRIDCARTWL